MQTLICCFPLPWRPSFSVRPENEAKDALKSTYGSLDNHSLLPTHSQYDLHKRMFELLTLSTFKNAFHSLRQYLGYDFIFGYTSRVLLHFRLYCSFAKEVQQNFYFTYCSLEYRLSREPPFASRRYTNRAIEIAF